jgi:hypothetical protein
MSMASIDNVNELMLPLNLIIGTATKKSVTGNYFCRHHVYRVNPGVYVCAPKALTSPNIAIMSEAQSLIDERQVVVPLVQ